MNMRRGGIGREPDAGRWLAAGGALLAFAVGLVTARIPHAPPGAHRAGDEVVNLILEHREAEAKSLARSLLARARRDYGCASRQAADAMDDLVSAVASGGDAGELAEAERLAGESIRIREKTCGTECLELAGSLEIYETLLWRFGDYHAALPLAEQALAIRTRFSGRRGPLVARSCYLLAEVHRALGDYAAAEALHQEAVGIWRADPAGHALDIANALHYQGMLRWAMGDLSGARERIGKAMAMREQALGGESDAVAASANTLGSLATAMGDRAAAMSLFDKGQAIWERTLGKYHPHVARSLSSKGLLLSDSGDYAAAKALFRRALEIRVGAFGADHYLVGRSLADLGRLAFRAGDDAEAERYLARALEIERKDPRTGGAEIASTLADEAKLALAGNDGARAVRLALEAEELARQDFLRTSRGLSEEDALRYETVRSKGLDVALTVLASAPSGGAAGLSGATERAWDELIRSRAMVLDAMESRRRGANGGEAGSPGLADVARRLPAASALVGFVRYTNAAERPAGSSASYLALVLATGSRRPAVVPIGGADKVEAAIRDWRREAEIDPRLAPQGRGEARYLEAGRRLRRLIWDPLAAELKDRRIVFVVPDGAINLVSLAALPDEAGRYLIESPPAIHYLSAERDVIAPEGSASPGTGVLALGDADFDAPPRPAAIAAEGSRSPSPACRAFRALRFDPLPGTRGELEDVASLWKARGGVLRLEGPRAREEEFKRAAPGRRILHLATHGYFLQDRCPSSLHGTLPPDGGVAVGDNPLRLSGLALAGANRRSEVSGTEEDGILTAEEIGRLDLSGTEWAVLSACETGVGQVLDGEGVVGLRRAFKAAGVATLIMTLWPVDDGAARIWTRSLYEGRLAGLSTVDAVSRASLRMIASQRASGGSTHPYYWGAFVATGDWR